MEATEMLNVVIRIEMYRVTKIKHLFDAFHSMCKRFVSNFFPGKNFRRPPISHKYLLLALQKVRLRQAPYPVPLLLPYEFATQYTISMNIFISIEALSLRLLRICNHRYICEGLTHFFRKIPRHNARGCALRHAMKTFPLGRTGESMMKRCNSVLRD